MMVELGEKNTFSDQVFTTFNDLPKAIKILFLYKHGIFLARLQYAQQKAFSALKYAKDMLAYRKGTPCCFIQQTTDLREQGSKCCCMKIFDELTCQKHMKRFEGCIFSQKYYHGQIQKFTLTTNH